MTYIEIDPRYSAPDSMATEFEVQDFLYGLIRLLKPKVILETGAYHGAATLAMLRAVKENGKGYIHSCDTNPTCAEMIDLGKYGCVRTIEGWKLACHVKNVDLAFLDSSGDRVEECASLDLATRGVVVLHDSKRPQYEGIKRLRDWVSIWTINTPRGLTILQS